MSKEDADEEAANISSDYKGYSSSISGDDARQPISKGTELHALSVYPSKKGTIGESNERHVDNDQTTNMDRGNENELEDKRDTNEIKNMKNNKRYTSNASKTDHQESDDPRRG